MRLLITVNIVFLLCHSALAQADSLQRQINRLLVSKDATVGVAIYGPETNDTLYINGSRHFPMQSVFKFHIALAVLNAVDQGRLSLDSLISTKQADLILHTWSPMQERYHGGDIVLPLDSIIAYAVSQSDNNACDILLRLIGGPKAVQDFIRALGYKDVSISATEADMHKAWNIQFKNWTTPGAAVQLLNRFASGKLLSKKSTYYLFGIMAGTSTGQNRIKGQLPGGTTVAHKTGTSGTNEQGITAAVNDIGIVQLPGGKYFLVAIFVTNSKETLQANEQMIAGISRLAWDYFAGRKR
ncbi:MAG: class A beta-lactamase, subclass A2 [Chitinophagaceae bacterium]